MDAEYWIRLKNGDPEALGYFYNRYIDKLFHKAMQVTDDRELAKDALQEVFIQLWNYRESLSEVRYSFNYLEKVLKSVMLRKIKREQHLISVPEIDQENWYEQENADTLVSAEVDKDSRTRLYRAFSTLTQRQREILELRFYQGMSYREIAIKLRMNYQSVNNLAFRTIVRLRNLMYPVFILLCLSWN